MLMKLFGRKKETPVSSPKITDTDREWVKEIFRWCLLVYGYPHSNVQQHLYTKEQFPESHKHASLQPEALLKDLCALLALDPNKVKLEWNNDLVGTQTPIEAGEDIFYSSVEFTEGDYVILFHNAVKSLPGRLLYQMILQLVKIRLEEDKIHLEGTPEDELLIYLVAIFYGFGVIIANLLSEQGRSGFGGWEQKWHYSSPMPQTVFAYALAQYSLLIDQPNPSWLSNVRADIQQEVKAGLTFLPGSPHNLYNEQEFKAAELFKTGSEKYSRNEFEAAITDYQKILFLAADGYFRALVQNATGYAWSRLGEYSKAIEAYRRAVDLNPDFAYAYDNLGYCFVMLGDFDKAKNCIAKAMELGGNEISYSYRNLALLYERSGDFNLARQYFQKSFTAIGTMPVDLLEFHYAQFLYKSGDRQEAVRYLEISIQKNEPEGISLNTEWQRAGLP